MPDDSISRSGDAADGGQGLRLVIPADVLAVRGALATLCDTPVLRGLPATERAAAELVLAEVLNNVVEHAYAGDGGQIEITLHPAPQGLLCQIVDHGTRMPGTGLPAGQLPPSPAADPPESGFGWHLIRTLSQDIGYDRRSGRNRLTFRLTATPPPEQSA